VDDASFKTSFTTRLGSLLSAQHKVNMADETALYSAELWTGTVKSQGYTYYNKDLIGFVETGHVANFFFRVSAGGGKLGELCLTNAAIRSFRRLAVLG